MNLNIDGMWLILFFFIHSLIVSANGDFHDKGKNVINKIFLEKEAQAV
jgi:hypothetical protein